MGNMGYAWIYVAALGVCFWWAPAMPCSYPTLQFTTTNDSPEYFYDFIISLRHLLESGKMARGIRLMREPSNVPVTQRFVLVELSNIAERQVTLAIDVVNAHVVAYRVRDEAFFFDDSSQVAYQKLFKDAVSNCTLPFDGSYGDLQNVAHQDRENIYLGRMPMDKAIDNLSLTRINGNYAPVAKALLVSIQMISEAARFNHIVQRVSNHTDDDKGFLPDKHMIWLENNWKYISKTVQRSTTEAGVFLIPFWFQDIQGQWRELYGVIPGLIMNIGLMIFVPSPSNFNSPLFIRPIGDVDDGGTHVCPAAPEPTVRIIGRDLQCVTVNGEGHSDGTALVLSSCQSDNDATSVVDQLWTLKRDGTIQSNGKCMTASAFSSQAIVKICDCQSANSDATKWQVWINGTIVNPHSHLVLQTNSCDNGAELQLNENTYSRCQGWLATNATRPPVTPISSVTNLCLQESEGRVMLETCDKVEQEWALYPDGSIRRPENDSHCLGYHSYNVVHVSCSPADHVTRWVFDNDGCIRNLYRGFVMEATNSKRVIVNSPSGANNQRWFINL